MKHKIKINPVYHGWAKKSEKGIAERIGDYFNIPCPLTILCPKGMRYLHRWIYLFQILRYLRESGIKPISVNVWWDCNEKPCVTVTTKRQQYKFACYLIDTTGKYERTML